VTDSLRDSFAQKIGCSKPTISNWCNDKVKNHDCDKIKKYAQVLNLNPDERRELMIAANCVPDDSDMPLVPIMNVPINHPRQFFGRQMEVKRILNK
jgi:transcriptional regulator with XRE-family HTH domain